MLFRSCSFIVNVACNSDLPCMAGLHSHPSSASTNAIADRSSGLNQNENTNAMRRAARADHVISNVPTGSSKSPLCGERGRRTNRELQALAHLRVENLAAVPVEPRRERRLGKDGAQPAPGERQPTGTRRL